MAETNAFNKQLWRDFDWDGYITARSPTFPQGKERDDFKRSVEITRNIARLMQEGPDPANMHELAQLEPTIPPRLFFQVSLQLEMIANVLYRAKHTETEKLTFAIGTIGQLSSLCKDHKIEEATPILRQFVMELGEDYEKRD